MTDKKLLISWEQFHRDSKALAQRLSSISTTFLAIVCVSRGGLVPAGIVSQELGIKLIDTICISSYSERNEQGELQLIKSVSPEILAIDSNRILVLDDLSDTGETMKLIQGIIPGAHFACVYAKPAGIGAVGTFVIEVPQDTWIVLPQELG